MGEAGTEIDRMPELTDMMITPLYAIVDRNRKATVSGCRSVTWSQPLQYWQTFFPTGS